MTTGIIQNKCNKAHAQSVVKRFLDYEKKSEIKKLEEKGYEYNDSIHILMELETIIPYEFVLYCILIEDKDKMVNDTKNN